MDACCICSQKKEKTTKPVLDKKLLEEKLLERERELREEFDRELEKETDKLTRRFDYILQNEQIRASYMLREARRERKEKIVALQQQLECKNMAALMYVMCAERTKCKVEKMQLIEIYTDYIHMLTNILEDGQELILHLSRGYKTAARVNYEWQEKMKKVIKEHLDQSFGLREGVIPTWSILIEFQAYIYHFSGTPLDQNQYLFKLPELLQVEASKKDDPNEDPIEEEESETSDISEGNKQWWELLDAECRPFAVYGDMSEFKPPQRREALKKIKAAKTAPRKWKEYMFHDMFLNSNCPNVENMKREYFGRVPIFKEIQQLQQQSENAENNLECKTTNSFNSRRQTLQSVDMRGNMGSILKLMAIVPQLAEPVTKANLLGARDSMEITSTTKLREKSKSADIDLATMAVTLPRPLVGSTVKLIDVRRASFVDENTKLGMLQEMDHFLEPESEPMMKPSMASQKYEEEDKSTKSKLCLDHVDSKEVIPRQLQEHTHVAINNERACPVKDCKRRHVDELISSLPCYMRSSPFLHFERHFEEYETCTPEQLGVLKHRIDERKKKEKLAESLVDFQDPLQEWNGSVQGVAVQTSNLSYLNIDLPPCTCREPNPDPYAEPGAVYRLEDLIPVKQKLDDIANECLFDNQIQFDRFKVIGQESDESIQAKKYLTDIKKNFTRDRLHEIQKIFKQHPSLLDLFQANATC